MYNSFSTAEFSKILQNEQSHFNRTAFLDYNFKKTVHKIFVQNCMYIYVATGRSQLHIILYTEILTTIFFHLGDIRKYNISEETFFNK